MFLASLLRLERAHNAGTALWVDEICDGRLFGAGWKNLGWPGWRSERSSSSFSPKPLLETRLQRAREQRRYAHHTNPSSCTHRLVETLNLSGGGCDDKEIALLNQSDLHRWTRM
jgi:hypothetical protein